jgi:prefoldin subunit 5
MAGEPLEIDVAELTIKDNASKSLEIVDKNLDKTKDSLGDTEKQVKDTEKEVSRLGKAFNRTSQIIVSGARKISRSAGAVGKGAGRGVQAGAKAGGAVLGGGLKGGLGRALGNVPLVGALLAGTFAAVASVRDQFVESVGLRKELLSFANEFQQSFRGQAKDTLKSFKKTGLFRTEDIQGALSGLTAAGVTPEAVQKNADILQKFATSQGFTTITEGIQALAGGQVKAGRGLGTEDIIQIQEVSSLLGNVATADQGFKLLTEILNKNKDSISSFSQDTIDNLKKVTKQQNEIIEFDQKRAKKAAEVGDELVKGTREFTLAVDEIKRSVAGGAETAITTTKKILRVGKRQAGGSVRKNNPVLVGEKGPEIFNPSGSGQVINNSSSKQITGGNVTINNTFQVSGNTAPRQFEKEISRILDKLFAGRFRQEAGLTPERIG